MLDVGIGVLGDQGLESTVVVVIMEAIGIALKLDVTLLIDGVLIALSLVVAIDAGCAKVSIAAVAELFTFFLATFIASSMT